MYKSDVGNCHSSLDISTIVSIRTEVLLVSSGVSTKQLLR